MSYLLTNSAMVLNFSNLLLCRTFVTFKLDVKLTKYNRFNIG